MSEEIKENQEQNLAGKTLAELSDLFRSLMESADGMLRSKEAEAIKSAFYKLLLKLKSEAADAGEQFVAVEENFKAIYSDYKRARAEYNKEQDALKAENLEKKQAIVEELKALVEGQDDVSSLFPAFRDIQDRWRSVGPVPATAFRDLNSNYQFYVEKFYDMVKINRDLRDLDFRKNYEAKEKFCEEAEKLAGEDNVVAAFGELQKLHEQWKELGPVAKEFRESIWARFQAATSVINKRYQAHFEELKEKQKENLEAKTALCEKAEEIAAREIGSLQQFNEYAKEIEAIQADWRKIGFATKKDNQRIYERFRAACDAFFARRRSFYEEYKSRNEENVNKKLDIIRRAEELKNSTEWKATTDAFLKLQQEWKEIGAVSRKRSEQLWKQFRAACDEFFEARDKNSPAAGQYANLKAKKALIAQIKEYTPSGDAADSQAAAKFEADWKAIGFVPFKEKDAVNAAFAEAMKEKFPAFRTSGERAGQGPRQASRPHSEKDSLIKKFNALQQEIETIENNIGFFAASKNSEAFIAQMRSKVESGKAELAALKEKIRKAEEGE